MAIGDIGSQLDTLAWVSATGSNPSIEIATGIFVSGSGCSLYSYSVAANGILAAIDTLVLPSSATISHIAHISGDVYAAACRYSNTAGTVYTFTVDSSGNIGAATIDSTDFSATLTYSSHICHVAGIVYAISYVYVGYSATVLTMNINDDGTIDASPMIDSWGWGSNVQPAIQRLFKVSGTTYAQAYTSKPVVSDPTSYIRTLTIADNGTITKAVIATYKVGGGSGSDRPYDMWYCAGSIYAYIFTYISGLYYPFIVTVSIDAAGTITPKASIQVEASTTYNDAYSMTAGADGATLIAACNNSSASTCKLFSFTVNTTTGIIAAVDSLLLTGNLGGAQIIRPRTNLLVVVGYKAAAGSIASVDYVEAEITVVIQVAQQSDDANHWSTPIGTFFDINISAFSTGQGIGFAGVWADLMESGVRFQGVTIPNGATITSAKLTYIADTDKSGTVYSGIYGEDADNAATFSTKADYEARSRVGSVSWTISSAWTTGSSYDSPDISAIIQAIVDRPGWSSGNSLVLFHGSPGNSYRGFYSYDELAGSAVLLTVTYTAALDTYIYPSSITSAEVFGSATIFPNISIIDSSVVNDYSAVGRCIVVSTSAPSGKRIFVFYRDPLNGGKYSYTDNDGVSWTTASFLTGSVVSEINSVRADMGPVVGMGPEIIHILYDDAVGDGACYNLCYRTLNPVTLVLGTEEVIDSGDISEGDTLTVGDLFVDSSDIPHVVYHFTDWTSGLFAIIYMDRSAPGGTWIGGVDLEIASGYVDSRLGSYGWAGTDVVVGMISNSGANTFLKAKEYVGGVWGSTVTVDSIAPPDGFTGLHVSNVVRTISYTSLTTIRLATESGGSWSHVTLDSAGTSYSGVSTSYFIDGGGDRRVHYWYDYDAGLLYEYRTNKETISTHYDSCGVCDCINVTPLEAFFAYCDESGGTYTLKFGINQWVSEQTVYSSSITSAETFGMGRMDQQLLSTGIASEEVFGSGRVDQQLLAVSIASAESVSNPAVGLGLWPPSITTEELFGTSRIDQQLMASGIPSGEVFGSEIVHRQITSIDVPTDGGTDSPVNWDTPTPTPGLPPTGWNDGGTTRSQSSTHRYSPTHKYKAHFLLEVVLGKAGGNMSSMDMETAITIGGEEYKAPTFRMEVYTE